MILKLPFKLKTHPYYPAVFLSTEWIDYVNFSAASAIGIRLSAVPPHSFYSILGKKYDSNINVTGHCIAQRFPSASLPYEYPSLGAITLTYLPPPPPPIALRNVYISTCDDSWIRSTRLWLSAILTTSS